MNAYQDQRPKANDKVFLTEHQENFTESITMKVPIFGDKSVWFESQGRSRLGSLNTKRATKQNKADARRKRMTLVIVTGLSRCSNQ